MKDYFSHDYNSRNDKKLVKAGMRFDLCSAIGAYWCIVEMLYEEGGFLLLSEYERITFELRCSNELVTFLIYDSELFRNDGEKFWSETAIERLKIRASKSQKARESIENRWNKIKNTNVLQTNNERNTSKVKKRKVNNKKEYGIKSNIYLTEDEFNKLKFDYPNEYQHAIDYLSNYKIEKSYKTKDDNLTIRRWVIDAVSKNIVKTKQILTPAR